MTDNAGFLSAPAADQLDQRLAEYDRTTGHQVLVYIDHTTGGLPIEDWAVKAFEQWRVGRKGIDDGVVLFVFSDDRRMRIEVGYGLEPAMPDTRASRIIREVIAPRLQAGDRDGAIRSGVDAILATLGGAGEAGTPAPAVPEHTVSPGRMLLGLVGLVVVLILLVGFAVTHPGLAWLLATMIGGGRRGGGGWGGGGGFGGGGFGGGGGFSGGGGRSGGGGASGSW